MTFPFGSEQYPRRSGEMQLLKISHPTSQFVVKNDKSFLLFES